MSTLLSSINEDKLKVRWEEPYVSWALNAVSGSFPCGVAMGFTPAPGGGLTLNLAVNSTTGLSALRLRDTTDGISVLYREIATVALDLTAFAGTKVYIGATADYDVGQATTAEIRAYTAVEFAAGVAGAQWFCGVDVPGSGAIAESDIDTSIRSTVHEEPFRSNFAPPFAGPNWSEFSAIGAEFLPEAPKTTGNVRVIMEAKAGSQSPFTFKYSRSAGSETVTRPLTLLAIEPNEHLDCSFRYTGTGATLTDAGLFITWFDAAMSSLGTEWMGIGALTTSSPSWTEARLGTVAPANAKWALVKHGVNTMSAGTFWMEQFRLFTPNSGNGRSRRTDFSARHALGLTLLGLDGIPGMSLAQISATESEIRVPQDLNIDATSVAVDGSLTVATDAAVTGSFSAGDASIDSALSIGSDLTVGGSATLAGNVECVDGDFSGDVTIDGEITHAAASSSIVFNGFGLQAFHGGLTLHDAATDSVNGMTGGSGVSAAADGTYRVPIQLPGGASIESLIANGWTRVAGHASMSITVKLYRFRTQSTVVADLELASVTIPSVTLGDFEFTTSLLAIAIAETVDPALYGYYLSFAFANNGNANGMALANIRLRYNQTKVGDYTF